MIFVTMAYDWLCELLPFYIRNVGLMKQRMWARGDSWTDNMQQHAVVPPWRATIIIITKSSIIFAHCRWICGHIVNPLVALLLNLKMKKIWHFFCEHHHHHQDFTFVASLGYQPLLSAPAPTLPQYVVE